MSIEWARLIGDDLPQTALEDLASTGLVERRVFAPKWHSWPLVTLTTHMFPSVVEKDESQSVKINCSYRLNEKAWWIEIPMPRALVNVVIEMLEDVETWTEQMVREHGGPDG